MSTLVDSHVHLDHAAFDADRAAVVARARAAGVAQLVVPAVDRASWQAIAELRPIAGLAAAYGLHPLYQIRHRREDLDALPGWLDSHAHVAVGEIGLDFHRDDTDGAAQRSFFRAQLEIAHARALPVIVHARNALEEIIQIMRRYPGLRGVVHSFSGSEQQARQLWDLGFHLGIGGPVTYERAKRLRRIVASMPLQWLLLESDAPDQPDAWHRGQRNEPARVVGICACVAGLRGVSAESIAAASHANAVRLFALESAAIA